MKFLVTVNGVDEIVDANDSFNALVGHSKIGFNSVSMAPKNLPGATQALTLMGLKVKVVEYKEPVVVEPSKIEPKVDKSKVVDQPKTIEPTKV